MLFNGLSARAAETGRNATGGGFDDDRIHTMFYGLEPEALREFFPDKPSLPFTDAVTDARHGLATHFKVPGGFTIELYQPSYQRKTVSAIIYLTQ